MEELINLLYPINSLYITASTASKCPLTKVAPDTEWELVSNDRVLQGSKNTKDATNTKEAGLPNIKGNILSTTRLTGTICVTVNVSNGVFYHEPDDKRSLKLNGGGSTKGVDQIDMDASRSNAVYGKSNTVQPPAYAVNVWRRTA